MVITFITDNNVVTGSFHDHNKDYIPSFQNVVDECKLQEVGMSIPHHLFLRSLI